jgi:hypothetical protein
MKIARLDQFTDPVVKTLDPGQAVLGVQNGAKIGKRVALAVTLRDKTGPDGLA